MASVLFDIDGVVANFVEPVLSLINKVGGYSYREEDIDQWDIRAALSLDNYEWAEVVQLIQTEGFASSLSLYEGAKANVRLINETHDVDFLTSDWRGSKTWVYDRNHWLVKQFGSLGKNVTHTSRKHKFAGDVFVEDKIDNAVKWGNAHPNGQAVLWTRPWNDAFNAEAHGVVRVASWEQLRAVIDG